MKSSITVALVSCFLVACGGGGGSSDPAAEVALTVSPDVVTIRAQAPPGTGDPASSSIAVSKLTKISETRTGRTTYDYVFKLTVNNALNVVTGVTFTLTTVGPGTTIIDGSSLAATLAAGETVDLSDTITLRHDRQIAFAPDSLAWTITTDPKQPPLSDVIGTDADTNGVRDDVQAFITAKFPSDPLVRDALLALARSYQAVALSGGQAQLEAAEVSRREAAICLADRTGPAKALELNASLRAVQLNTEARYAVEMAFRDQLAGKSVVAQLTTVGGTCK